MTSCHRLSTLVIVDSTVADHQNLVRSVNPEAKVLILNRKQDGIEQITQVLETVEAVESLHILSHGSSGSLQLGSTNLSWQTLERYTSQLRTWARSLANAEVLLYGCQVAAGTIGQWFVQQLKALTHAEIAASTNLTGNSALGGDWILEFATGPIQTPLAFSQKAMLAYPHVLATLVTDTFAGDDVVDRNWLTGVGTPVAGSPAPQQPFLTARNTVIAPIGGIQGSSTGALDAVGNGALRLTNNIADQAAFVLYDRPISSTDGLTITFELYAYGGSTNPDRADGVSFFLLDGSTSPTTAGAFGGSLGYAQKNGIAPGLAGGYLGIGFDEYGNFSNPTDSDTPGAAVVRTGGPGRVADTISIRGGATSNYQYITGTDPLPFGIDDPTATTRDPAKRIVKIDLTPEGLLTVRIDGNNDGDFLDPGESDPRLTNINIANINGTTVPSTLKFGFASGTGSFNNIHEIRNLAVTTQNDPPEAVDFRKIVSPGTTVVLSDFSATDANVADGDLVASYTILSLPTSDQGVLYLGDPATGGVPITIGTALTPAQIQTIYFQSTSGFNGATFTYTATDRRGASDETPATVTLGVRNPNNRPPDTNPSQLELPRNSTKLVPNLSGTDPDGDATVESFRVLTLPPQEQGILYLGDPANGGTPIRAEQVLTPDQIKQIYFKSSGEFTGTSFTYVAVDDQGDRDPSPAVVRLSEGVVDPDPLCQDGKNRKGTNSNNTLKGTPDSDKLRGLNGNDKLLGRACNDVLDGGKGNDKIAGGADRDLLLGRPGKDLLRGNAGDDVINGGLGNDKGSGGKGNDIVHGKRGNDKFSGKGGNDQLLGGRGRDKLNGGTNQDTLNGQQGDDELQGAKGRDFLNGGLGRDRLRCAQKADTVYGRRGDDVIWGGGGRDVLRGNRGNDRMAGNTQVDRLVGGYGDDVMVGGGGNDIIKTGKGADRIVYKSAAHGFDRIRDFDSAVDQIDLRPIFKKSDYTSSNPFDAYVKISNSSGGAILRVDSNGEIKAGFVRLALLEGVNATSINTTNCLV